MKRNDNGPIDWQQIRRRLERATRATEEFGRLAPERARAVLEERARALARPPALPAGGPEGAEALVFTLAGERYALETRHVREVVPRGDLTPLPGAPAFLAGLVNLRGQVLAAFDLRPLFGLATPEPAGPARLVVLGGGRAEFGVLAEAVPEVVALRPGDVLEPPGTVAGVAREFLRGVTGEGLVVLDGDALLRDPRLVIDQGDA